MLTRSFHYDKIGFMNETGSRRHPAASGGKWIRPVKRLAIYLRDGLACAYCGDGVEDEGGVMLSLDHIKPHVFGGSNAACNLVTACRRCNSARGTRSVRAFAAATAQYLNISPDEIVARVSRLSRRVPRMDEARKTIAARQPAQKEQA